MYRGTTRKYRHSSKYDTDALHITDRTNAVRLGIKIHLVSMAKDIRGQKLKMAVRPSKCVSFHDFNIMWEVPILVRRNASGFVSELCLGSCPELLECCYVRWTRAGMLES